MLNFTLKLTNKERQSLIKTALKSVNGKTYTIIIVGERVMSM